MTSKTYARFESRCKIYDFQVTYKSQSTLFSTLLTPEQTAYWATKDTTRAGKHHDQHAQSRLYDNCMESIKLIENKDATVDFMPLASLKLLSDGYLSFHLEYLAPACR